MLYLIRHAHAGNKHVWSGPDELRPLSPRGRREADALVGMLAGHRIRRILTSPTARCRQTVAPLAAERRLPVLEVPALTVDASVEALDRLLRDPATDEVALCTHGETIAALFDHLDRRVDGRVELAGPRRWEKGSVWLLDGYGGPTVRATYLPPVFGPA